MLPARLLGAVTLLCAVLLVQADTAPVATVLPTETTAWEGQDVRVAGILQDPRPGADGRTRFLVTAHGTALPVTLDGLLLEGHGTWVEAEGRLVRVGGRLTLLAHEVAAAPTPGPRTPTWDQIADDPGSWTDRWIRMQGIAESGRFGADGTHVMQGDGAWTDGTVQATGHLAYDPGCLCHRFHAATVRPWTP